MINPRDSHEIEAKYEISEETFLELKDKFKEFGSPEQNFGLDDFYTLPNKEVLRFRHRLDGGNIKCEMTIKKIVKPPYVRRENEICFDLKAGEGILPAENFIRDLGGNHLVSIFKEGVNIDIHWQNLEFWLTTYSAMDPKVGIKKYFFEIETSKEVSIKYSVEDVVGFLNKFTEFFLEKEGLKSQTQLCDRLLFQFFT